MVAQRIEQRNSRLNRHTSLNTVHVKSKGLKFSGRTFHACTSVALA
jgi:hypothetical protein